MGSLAMTTFTILVLLSCLIVLEAGESFYMVTEKPVIIYTDPSIFVFMNLTSSRYGRRSELYYVGLHMELAKVLDNNYTMQVVFYEAVSTGYKRSFIEIHYKLCNFIFIDPIFGAAIRKQIKVKSCPVPKGVYHFNNMTASADHLPPLHFKKGRINMDLDYNKKNVFKGYIDLELKRKKKN